MGKIIRFPIYVDTTKSSETSYGLLNILQPTVRELSIAARDSTVSEKGLARSLSGLSFVTSGVNLGEGSDIFISAGIVHENVFNGSTNALQYRTIDLSGSGFNIIKNNGVIYLTSDQETPGSSIDMKYFNGGILQSSNSVDVSDLVAGSKTLFRMPVSRTAFGKLMIMNNTAFGYDTGAVTGDIVYSIGTNGNPSGIVQNISTLGTVGALVDFNYGNMLTDKVEYVENGSFTNYDYVSGLSGISGEVTGGMWDFNAGNLIAYDDIKIYKSVPVGVSSHTQGALDIVMFYDNPDVPMSESHMRNTVYIPGGRTGGDDWSPLADADILNHMQKYDIENGTSSIESNMTMPEKNCRYALLQNSDKMWYMGGQADKYKSSMFRVTPFNSTINLVPTIFPARAKSCGVSTNVNGYVFCGGTETAVPAVGNVLKMNFSTEATNVLDNAANTFDRTVVSRWCGNDYAYIMGGRTNASTVITNDKIYEFSLVTDTFVGDLGNTYVIPSLLYSMNTGSNHLNAYFFGGHSSQTTSTDMLFLFNYATKQNTGFFGSQRMPSSNGSAACSTNASHTDIYVMGGNDNGVGGITDQVVKFSIANYCIQLINRICIPVTDARGGRL